MGDITANRYQDLVFPRDIYVAGRILRRARYLHVLACNGLSEVAQRSVIFQLNVNREGVSVKDWRLQQDESRNGSAAIQQFAQMAANTPFNRFQRA